MARADSSSGSVNLPELPPEIYADIAPFLRTRPSGTAPFFNALAGSLDFSYIRDFGDNNIGNPIRGVSAKMAVVTVGGTAQG